MVFDAAIQEHAEVKVKLILFLNNSGCIDEKRLSKPASCSFGVWLKQCSRQYSHITEFNDVVATHKKFHLQAGEILTLIQNNKRFEAKEALQPEGSFSDLTAELNRKVLLLKRRLSKLA